MEDNVGKLCPFCKTVFKNGDNIKVCPACKIPHHQECWDENGGCSTFGCSEQKYEPKSAPATNLCPKCGTTLDGDPKLCPNCGPIKIEELSNICGKCGAQLQQGQEFCSKCGQKAGLAIESGTIKSINEYNADVAKKKKTKPLPFILGAVAFAICIVAFFMIQSANIKKAKEDYKKNAQDFVMLTLAAGGNLETIANTVRSYWYDSIWNDTHRGDINVAISDALIDKSSEISKAKNYDTQIKELYSKLKTIPNGVDDSEFEDICDAVKELYNTYSEFYTLATSPSGNYNSYSTSFSTLDSEFMSSYRALNNLLE